LLRPFQRLQQFLDLLREVALLPLPLQTGATLLDDILRVETILLEELLSLPMFGLDAVHFLYEV
jgi:hypothetical protein